MTDITTTVERYLALWNEPDPDARARLIATTFTDDATYVDPLMAGAGAEQINAMVGGAQAQYPGHRFELAAGPDAHNDRVRFSWHLVGADGPIALGIDFATVADDGRLRDVTGFLEPVAG